MPLAFEVLTPLRGDLHLRLVKHADNYTTSHAFGFRSVDSASRRSSFAFSKTRRFGGARRDRTADLYNAIVALSQLSYGPGIP